MSISTSQVMEYDPFSQEFQADPFPVYRWMRDEAPVFYSEKHLGNVPVERHARNEQLQRGVLNNLPEMLADVRKPYSDMPPDPFPVRRFGRDSGGRRQQVNSPGRSEHSTVECGGKILVKNLLQSQRNLLDQRQHRLPHSVNSADRIVDERGDGPKHTGAEQPEERAHPLEDVSFRAYFLYRACFLYRGRDVDRRARCIRDDVRQLVRKRALTCDRCLV